MGPPSAGGLIAQVMQWASVDLKDFEQLLYCVGPLRRSPLGLHQVQQIQFAEIESWRGHGEFVDSMHLQKCDSLLLN